MTSVNRRYRRSECKSSFAVSLPPCVRGVAHRWQGERERNSSPLLMSPRGPWQSWWESNPHINGVPLAPPARPFHVTLASPGWVCRMDNDGGGTFEGFFLNRRGLKARARRKSRLLLGGSGERRPGSAELMVWYGEVRKRHRGCRGGNRKQETRNGGLE